MEIKQTTDYDMFKFRSDNRVEISENDVITLADKISANNLLHLHPIIVNDKFEIFQGQHRLLAAKKLEVPIYYVVDNDIEASDLIDMNYSKQWRMLDYFHYYHQHRYPEYEKLGEFIRTSRLPLQTALSLTSLENGFSRLAFQNGKYCFDDSKIADYIEVCQKSVKIISEFKPTIQFTKTVKFWKALLALVQHPDFDADRWLQKLELLSPRIKVRATSVEYLNLFVEIYNHRSKNPITVELS